VTGIDRKPVTVAIDASWLRDGGIARMATEIIARAPEHVRVLEIRRDSRNAGLLTPVDLAIEARRTCADIIWSPGFMPPVIGAPGKRICITIHDLAHLHHYSIAHRVYYDVLIRKLLQNVDRIFTVSDYTRNEILAWAPIDASRVIRIYNGVSNVFRLATRNDTARPPYVLYAGNRRGYKNIERMISAFARSRFAAQGGELWLTGARDAVSSHHAARHGVTDRVHYLGTLSDAELAQAYADARALMFVSLYEGFGLPVVEAMAAGCPVLTSNTTALAEIAGNAALTVDPTSTEAIADGLDRLCTDDALRNRLCAAGLRRAADFHWDRCAAGYWQAIAGT
jgi:glycosyltransferase involved in cell wall biosynthesis